MLVHDRFDVHRDIKFLEKPKRQILATPAHNAVDGGDRTAFDKPCQRLALIVIQLRRLTRRFSVNQAHRPTRIEPQNPVPDHLQTN